jgi:hypothetical protein
MGGDETIVLGRGDSRHGLLCTPRRSALGVEASLCPGEMSGDALVRSMLILRRDKKNFLVGFGCYTVNIFLFRSSRQREDPKLRSVFDSPRLRLEPTCAPKFR